MEEQFQSMSIKPTLRPIALCAALLSALLFTGCSSLDITTGQSDQDGASKLARATTAFAMAAVTPSAPTAKSKTTQADALQDDAREAVGTPTDPLRPDTTLNLDDVAANQDLWARVRRGFGLPELDIALVGDHERWYSSRPDYVQRMTERSSRYLFHVLEEIERRQMPTELALLPFIESAFNPQAQSTARASGI